MKARPILFSAPMIRALIDGRKTQTRRVVKPQPFADDSVAGWAVIDRAGSIRRWHPALAEMDCPYGKPGELLYVKEAWRAPKCLDDLSGSKIAEKCLDAGYRRPWCPIQYEADGTRVNDWRGFGAHPSVEVPGRYRHARFMPRWASRITLRLTDVRVERVQEISKSDAAAEGLGFAGCLGLLGDWLLTHYQQLWEDINGADSWDANPWVWALNFDVILANVDQVLAEAA